MSNQTIFSFDQACQPPNHATPNPESLLPNLLNFYAVAAFAESTGSELVELGANEIPVVQVRNIGTPDVKVLLIFASYNLMKRHEETIRTDERWASCNTLMLGYLKPYDLLKNTMINEMKIMPFYLGGRVGTQGLPPVKPAAKTNPK